VWEEGRSEDWGGSPNEAVISKDGG
jgi:hypothetical protein